MAYNGSGDYSLPAGQPVVTGTTISSTTHNNLANDLATAFDTAFCRDGQAAATALWDMGGFRITNLGAATAVAHAVIASQVQNNTMTLLASVTGTDTIAGTATPTPAAYASGQIFRLVPANTNTGATTLNVSGLGAKSVFWNGAACVGGELRQNIPAEVQYDGTQFHIIANGFNAPFLDTHPVVQGSADSTKKVRIEVDGLTTATTRVVTVPDRDITIGDLNAITNSLSGDVALNNTSNYFTGPTLAQGTEGTWFAAGTVTVNDSVAAATFDVKLWDGTTVIASARARSVAAGEQLAVALSGYISSPAGNIRISVKDVSLTTGSILFNASGNSKDSTLTAIRVA